jgi:hypothetical protein
LDIPPLLFADFEFPMWYYPLVSYHTRSKNTVGEVQTSNGEQSWYGILPNKHCKIVKLATKALLKELYQKKT